AAALLAGTAGALPLRPLGPLVGVRVPAPPALPRLRDRAPRRAVPGNALAVPACARTSALDRAGRDRRRGSVRGHRDGTARRTARGAEGAVLRRSRSREHPV